MFDYEITIEEIEQALKRLKLKKSCGPEGESLGDMVPPSARTIAIFGRGGTKWLGVPNRREGESRSADMVPVPPSTRAISIFGMGGYQMVGGTKSP